MTNLLDAVIFHKWNKLLNDGNKPDYALNSNFNHNIPNKVEASNGVM